MFTSVHNTPTKAELKFIHSLQQKKHRDETGLFVAEGDKCINELLQYFHLVRLLNADNTSPSDIERVSSPRNPQGSIAVFNQPHFDLQTIDYKQLILVLDDIQDPGNLGTILRTCAWFGIDDVICSEHTADCYSPKVVQATMGALAHVRVHYVQSLPQYLNELRNSKPELNIYGTLLEGKNIYSTDALPEKKRGIIIMGNEGNGISQQVREFVTHPIYIPSFCSRSIESLNVAIATAVTLAYFRQP